MEFTDKDNRWFRTTGGSVIHYYAKKGNTEEVLNALETTNQGNLEANLFVRSSSLLTPIHYCAIYGRTNTAVEILYKADSIGQFKRMMSSRSINGSTPLHSAFESGRIRTAIRLIELGGARYLSLHDNEGHQPLEVCDRRVRVAVEDEVKRAIRSYYFWGRRRGFVMLCAQLKRSRARYEKAWKSLHFDETAIKAETMKTIEQQSKKAKKHHPKFIGLKRCTNRNNGGNKAVKDQVQEDENIAHFYHHDDLSCPRKIYGQASVRGIIAENYYRFRVAGYANEESYKTDNRGLSMWGNPGYWENKLPFGERGDETGQNERDDLAASIFFFGGSGDDSFIRVLKHMCIGDMKPRHPQKGRSGGFGDANVRDYVLSSKGLAGKRSLHHEAEGQDEDKEEGARREKEGEEECAARRKHTIFKPHQTHKPAWKKIQELYHDDLEGDEVKMVRRLRHAETGFWCYFRKEKEFLFEHKGVDPKEMFMAYVLLREDVYSRIVSFL